MLPRNLPAGHESAERPWRAAWPPGQAPHARNGDWKRIFLRAAVMLQCHAHVATARRSSRLNHSNQPTDHAGLIDPFGRRIHYLRLSVTDRCDLRCRYCMTEGVRFLPRAHLLTLEENARLCRVFCDLGIDRIRVTGGEPLTRRNLPWLLERLSTLPGLQELTLTTNARRLANFAAALHRAGVARLNISLDTLDAHRFQAITGGGQLADTLAGIQAARALDFRRLKLNSVILAGINQDEPLTLLRFAIAQGCDISFIEQMPLGASGDGNESGSFYSTEHVRADLARHVQLVPSTERSGGPSRYYHVTEGNIRVGFISPRSRNFCSDCNRVRVTAEGRLLSCLGAETSTDLRRLLRAHPDDDEPLKSAIRAAIAAKPRRTDFARLAVDPLPRAMHATGG